MDFDEFHAVGAGAFIGELNDHGFLAFGVIIGVIVISGGIIVEVLIDIVGVFGGEVSGGGADARSVDFDGEAEDGAPVDAGAIAPEHFEVVEVAAIGVEDVDDDVDAIHEDPFGGLIAVGFPSGEVHFFAEVFGFIDDGAHLSWGGAGGDDEEFRDGGFTAEVEEDDVFAAGIGGEFGDGDGELERGGRIGGKFRGIFGSANDTPSGLEWV